MPYSDIELERLMAEIETDFVERKESWLGSAPEKGRQAVCAFANDLPSRRCEGVLFVGVKDDGTPSGLQVTDQLLQTLSDIKTDGRILPPPSLTVDKRYLSGSDVAVVHVRPSDSPPVRYEGRCWIRVGPRRAVATLQEERVLAEKRRSGDRPFDIRQCNDAQLSDLDLRFFEDTYLPSAMARDVLQENGRTRTEQLSSLKFCVSPEDSSPTHLGVLVSGKNPGDLLPGAYVEFLRFNGHELTDEITDSATISGRLDEVILKTEDKFKSHNQVSIDLISRTLEVRSSSYPFVAFQQLFRNSVMHRTYEHTNTPIRVYWFHDRVELLSPGGPYGAVTPENFSRPGITDYRNPNIAEAMKNLGFAQRFGVGIATAQKALAENGNPPAQYDLNSGYVLVVMRLIP